MCNVSAQETFVEKPLRLLQHKLPVIIQKFRGGGYRMILFPLRLAARHVPQILHAAIRGYDVGIHADKPGIGFQFLLHMRFRVARVENDQRAFPRGN